MTGHSLIDKASSVNWQAWLLFRVFKNKHTSPSRSERCAGVGPCLYPQQIATVVYICPIVKPVIFVVEFRVVKDGFFTLYHLPPPPMTVVLK
ncbi:hypothetical protein J6590_076986 [Homalodisca vitripennis]|nr:hypothetical protein J6590_076986 [Homalodisca vitripennis]